MKSLARTPFGAVFYAELLFNLKRVAPYVLIVLFSANAVLWWAAGPAISRGWAVNSDFYIVRLFGGFSFMTLPLFIALMMGDPVIRDFRTRIDPLILSKPISRAEYLLGKFSGNFFVLVCCQAGFMLTLLLLQAFSTSGMIVQPARVIPYFKHFFFFVVVSSLALAAICFTVGTLTRNIKIVYGLATSFYLLYIAWQVTIKDLPLRWRLILDPLLFNLSAEAYKGRSAEWLNQYTISYDGELIVNRVLMAFIAIGCLTILHLRFSRAERFKKNKGADQITTLDLLIKEESVLAGIVSSDFIRPVPVKEIASQKNATLPKVSAVSEGFRAKWKQFIAALGVEVRLLYAERSLVVIVPLATLLCVLGLVYYEVTPGPSYSAAYASRTADSLLLFLIAIAIFYAGEALHRDRELRFEPVLWSTPTPNFVLLLSKFSATLMLSLFLMLMVALAAIIIQLFKGHAPVELPPYFILYSVILVPSVIFMIGASVALNVLLRDKYLAYAVSLAIGGGLFYLYSQGYNHWLYNPVLYQLWTPNDLTGAGGNLARILTHRIHCLALAALCLSLAHLFFGRKSAKGLLTNNRLNGVGWSVLVMAVSALIAVMTGLRI